jgi:predicted amino acid dehydrogenase
MRAKFRKTLYRQVPSMTIGNSDNAYAASRIGVLAAKEEVMSKNTEKVAFITGANRGLGFETAHELGEAGVRVIFGARSAEAGEKAAVSLHPASKR